MVAMALPGELGSLQCPSIFCAETDSSTKGCRGPWAAAGQAPSSWTWLGSGTDEPCKCTQAPSAAVPALGSGRHTRYQARDWRGDWHVGTHPHMGHTLLVLVLGTSNGGWKLTVIAILLS